ncbi:OmpA/MotB domain-containing protein [Psychromonas sp. CNPT3]|uniref:OmpA family protein n=1 Tax=Psychromonas sp. CNPT3 TaxID=314282 RepID=UPI00006E566E|nr:OmpA family protein [Psychromonas sp. CNPT3]AGH80837.1 OmpA/MotB domain-containing protein [Psychromonas sp. CNPT3]
MKLFLIMLLTFFVSACSLQAIDMAKEPTEQKFDLSDEEADGVILARDNCPGSVLGADINNNGCGLTTAVKVRAQLMINFETDSYVVSSNYLPKIEHLSQFMHEYPQTTVTIEGHTSHRGTASYNKILSQQRADMIKKILIEEYQVEASRITAIGYGFDQLLLEGDDEYVHARNRRIVAEISSEKHISDMKWTIYTVDQSIE